MPGDVPVTDLPGLSHAEVERLNTAGVETVDDLWRLVGSDFERGMEKAAPKTGVPAHRLAEVLLSRAEREAARAEAGGARVLSLVPRFWPEVLLGLAVVGVIALFCRPILVPTVVVTQPTGLRAFQRIEPRDVTVMYRSRTEPSVETPAALLGRYALQYLPPDASVRAHQVSQRPVAAESLRGRTAVGVDVEPVNPIPSEGETVSLLISRGGGQHASLVLKDTLVLTATQVQGRPRLVLAIPDADIGPLAAILGDSKVFVLRPLLPSAPPSAGARNTDGRPDPAGGDRSGPTTPTLGEVADPVKR